MAALDSIFEVQAILQALITDARLRAAEGEGMIPEAAETLAQMGWQILEDLDTVSMEPEEKDQAKVVSLSQGKPAG